MSDDPNKFLNTGSHRDLSDPPDLPVHYLHNTPSPVFGIVALVVSLGLLTIGISQVRDTARNETSITVSTGGNTKPDGVPVLTVTTGAWSINGQPVPETDLLFRLSALAAKSQAVVIEHNASVTAGLLTKALETVNRAGFAQVGVRQQQESNVSPPQ